MQWLLVTMTVLGLIVCPGAAGAATIDFDALVAGTAINTVKEVTFTENIIDFDLVVSTGLDTTSGANYLGVDDGGFEVFFPGDIVTLDFAVPVTRLALDFISSPVTPGQVFSIDTTTGSSMSAMIPADILADGGEVFPVAFVSATPFSSAQLVSVDTGEIYSYSIDSIDFTPVPLPSALLLFSSGLVSVGILLQRRRSTPGEDNHLNR